MNVRQIKQRALAVEKTKKIVKAMQVVALTRLKKLESVALHGKVYFEAMKKIVEEMSRDLKTYHPLLQPRPEKRSVWVAVIGSDKGLCGNFNSNMFRGLEAFLERHSSASVVIVPLGKKVLRYVQKRHPDRLGMYLERIDDKELLNKFLDDLQHAVVEGFIDRKLDGFYILYSEFKGHVLGKVAELEVLPLGDVKPEGESPLLPNFIFEPDEEQVLEEVIKEYIASQVNQTLLESRAAEELSRMMAMKSATDAADKMLSALMLSYHKARQANITKEIIEIINAQGV